MLGEEKCNVCSAKVSELCYWFAGGTHSSMPNLAIAGDIIYVTYYIGSVIQIPCCVVQ